MQKTKTKKTNKQTNKQTNKLKLKKKCISCCEDKGNRKDRHCYLSVLFCRESISKLYV